MKHCKSRLWLLRSQLTGINTVIYSACKSTLNTIVLHVNWIIIRKGVKYIKMRFVDAKNAFEMVKRDCLWYELMCIGIKGKFLNAVQSLYINLSCTVKVNNLLNGLVQCNTIIQGVKQGCVIISPTLFFHLRK